MPPPMTPFVPSVSKTLPSGLSLTTSLPLPFPRRPPTGCRPCPPRDREAPRKFPGQCFLCTYPTNQIRGWPPRPRQRGAGLCAAPRHSPDIAVAIYGWRIHRCPSHPFRQPKPVLLNLLIWIGEHRRYRRIIRIGGVVLCRIIRTGGILRCRQACDHCERTKHKRPPNQFHTISLWPKSEYTARISSARSTTTRANIKLGPPSCQGLFSYTNSIFDNHSDCSDLLPEI